MIIPRGMFTATAPATHLPLAWWLEMAVATFMYCYYMRRGIRVWLESESLR